MGMSAGQRFTTELPVVKQPRKKRRGKKKPKKAKNKSPKAPAKVLASKCREILKPE